MKSRTEFGAAAWCAHIELNGVDLKMMPAPDLIVGEGEWYGLLWGTFDRDLRLELVECRMRDLAGLAKRIHSAASGVYFLLLYNVTTNETAFFTDYFSCKKVFYCQTSAGLHFADNFYVLAKSGLIRKDLDLASVATFLMYDYIPTNHTLVKGIRSVRPFCIYFTKGHSISESQLHYPVAHPKPMDYMECVEETYRRLEQAFLGEVGRHSHLVVPLSGGQDSRLLLALALKHYDTSSLTTFTFGQPGTLDYEIGCGLAQHLGLRTERFAINRSFFDQHIVPSTRYLNAITNHILAPSNFLSQRFNDLSMGVVASGYIGDLVLGSKDGYIQVSCDGDFKYPTPKQCRLSQVLPLVPDAGCEVLDRLALVQSLVAGSCVREGIPLETWYYVVRVTCYTSIGLFSERLKIKFITPFVNRKFLEWSLSIPHEYKVQNNFYRDLAACDSIARRLFEYPLKNRNGTGAWDTGMKALTRKITHKVKAAIFDVKPKQNFANFEAMYPDHFVSRAILKDDFLFKIFNRKAVLELIEQMSYSQKTLLLALRLHLECLQDGDVLSQN